MKNYFSANFHLLTNDLIGMIIGYMAFISLVLVPPERLQIPFAISFFLFAGSCLGILVWAVHNAGGPGAIFHKPVATDNPG